jgi:hypothetical protein
VIVDPTEHRRQDEQLPRLKTQVRGFPSAADVRQALDEETDFFRALNVEPIGEPGPARFSRGEFG